MIDRSSRPAPADIANSISVLHLRLDALAQEAGVASEQCIDLECTLAAVPLFLRRRITVLLQAVQLNAELNGNPAMVFAAGYVLALAQDVWTANHNRTSHDVPAPLH